MTPNYSTFELESIEPLSDRPHPRAIAHERVTEFRQKKQKKPMLTQADMDRGAEFVEPLGPRRKLFWKASHR